MNRKSIPILYEDDDVLVINKPAGLVVHSDGRTKEPTLVEWILKKYPKIKGVGDKIEDLGFKIKKEKTTDLLTTYILNLTTWAKRIVHRLDKKQRSAQYRQNQDAFYFLKHQFKKQEVRKTYHAFVYGRVKNDDGLIDRPIARSRTNPVLWSATRGRKGEDREAITEYRVLGRLILPYQGEHLASSPRRGVHESDTAFTFLELYPRTGRTHQLRVHLKAINYPIVADKLYAPNRETALGFKRLALHSRLISFLLPNGKRMSVEAPYPKDFEAALKIFGKHQ